MLEQYLQYFKAKQNQSGVDWLSWVEFSYNTSVNTSTKVNSFEAVYGIQPFTLLSYVPRTTSIEVVDVHLRNRDQILKDLHYNLHHAQDCMRAFADPRSRDVTIEVGTFIYLKLQPYRQQYVAYRKSMKLAPRFFGPYQIIKHIGDVAYRLEVPPDSKIHNVFHVCMLRCYRRSVTHSLAAIPPMNGEAMELLHRPDSILEQRVVSKGKYHPKEEILVTWKGTLIEDAACEDACRFARRFPYFIFPGKDF